MLRSVRAAPDTPTLRQMLDFVATITRFTGRIAGSEAERNSQAALAGRLHDLGMDAVVAGCVAPPHLPVILTLHAAVFLSAALLVLLSPPLSVLMTLVALLSFWGELRGRPRLLQRLLLKRITGNMVARQRNQEARAQIILVAHADVATSSVLFLPWFKRFTLRREAHGRGLHPGSLVVVAAGAQAVAATLLWDAGRLGVVPLVVIGAACIVHAGLLLLAVDWWRSPPVEGAIDNGSGMSVVLAAAEALSEDPLDHCELWVVSSGAREPDAEGMQGFVRQFDHLLEPDRTFVINVDDVGQGRLHVVVAEGRWERLAYRPTLPALAEQLAAEEPFTSIAQVDVVGTTDAGPPTRAGYRAVTLTSLVDGSRPEILHTHQDTLDAIDPASLAQALDFTLALCRSVDGYVRDTVPPRPPRHGVTAPGSPTVVRL